MNTVTLQRTLIISVILHAVFFSAALVLLKGGRDMQIEDIFFVKLTEERAITAPADTAINKKTDRPANLKREMQKDVEYHSRDRAIVKEVTPDKQETVNKQVEAVGNVLQTENPGPGQNESARGTEDALNNGNHSDTVNIVGYSSPASAADQHSDKTKAAAFNMAVRLIGSAIERAKSYPLIARRRGMEGTVHVSFRINANGNAEDITIKKSSGFEVLDTATLNVIRKAGPYPYVESRVEIPVTFRLTD